MLFGRKSKKKPLFDYQQEKNAFAILVEGTKFIYVAKTESEARSISGQLSPQGVGGGYSAESHRPEYDCFVVPSGSIEPLPIEEWRRRASSNLPTASAGEALPEQLDGLSFSFPSGASVTVGPVAGIVTDAGTATATATFGVWKQVVKPSLDYVVRRIREGFELYQQEYEVPDAVEPKIPDVVELQLVTFFANTPQGGYYYPAYHPLSQQDVMEALQQMERDGEIRIEGSEVRFLSQTSS